MSSGEERGARGWVGVDGHRRGYGNTAPIVGTPSKGYSHRPLYYGTQFAQNLDSVNFLEANAVPHPPLGHYALRPNGRDRIAVIDRGDPQVAVMLFTLAARHV